MNSDKQELVPRLRFPEFRGTEGWESSPASEKYSFLGNNSLSRENLNYSEGELRNVHYGDIHTKFSPLFRVDAESVPFVNPGAAHSAIRPDNYCAAGDMIFADASEDTEDIGKAIEVLDTGEHPLVAGLHTILARPNHPKFASGYGAYLFQTPPVRKQIQREAQGAKVLGLSATRLGNVQLMFPHDEAEQLKIAACLSSLDDLIVAETKTLGTLKTFKKGLMQQIFPQEGETVPRLRFPEFRGAGEWGLVRAGTLFANRVERGTPDLPIYSVTMTDGMVLRSSMDRKIDDLVDSTGNKLVRKGDLAYNMMRMWQGALGVAVEDCMVSPAYIVLAPTHADPWFFFYHWKLPQSLRTLTAHSRGLTEDRLRLYYDDFSKMSVRAPSLPEQSRIAAFLSSLDRCIAAQAQKIDALKTHKKGLMQGLFPAVPGDAD